MAPIADPNNLSSAKSAKLASTSGAVDYHQVDNTFRLNTPENISFEYQLAGPFRRVFPYLLDLVIVFMSFYVLMLGYAIIAGMIVGMFGLIGIYGIAEFFEVIGNVLGTVGLFVLYWFYGAYMETYFNGRTLGKMMVGLRVLSTNGHAIDGVQATLRNFFRLIDLMPLITFGALIENNDLIIPLGMGEINFSQIGLPTAAFGLIAMSLSPKFQRLGDLVAGTMVVNRESSLDPDVQTFADSRVPQLAELIPASFYVSNSLAKAVASYVERREQLGVARAGEIAAKLAWSLCKEFDLPTDTDADLLICSLYYKTFVGQSHEKSGHSDLPSGPPASTSRYQLPVQKIETAGPVSIATDQPEPVTPDVPVAIPMDASTDGASE